MYVFAFQTGTEGSRGRESVCQRAPKNDPVITWSCCAMRDLMTVDILWTSSLTLLF